MRLFIAILLNEEMKKALTDVQAHMHEGGVSGKYSPEENLHVTLAFVGEYPDPEVVLGAMKTVEFTPFELALDGFGYFGDTLWAGMEPNSAMQSVVRRIRRALTDHQIPFDKKAFRAHITLIRKAVPQHDMPSVELQKARMSVGKISLMRSDLGKNGMIYTELGAITPDRQN